MLTYLSLEEVVLLGQDSEPMTYLVKVMTYIVRVHTVVHFLLLGNIR